MPRPTHPYYVVAPPYSDASAGIRALHRLADALNRAGAEAYIFCDSYIEGVQTAPADFRAPHLTWLQAEAHRAAKRRPIVVYPEVVIGNPLRARAVVRYVLNVPGLLGGASAYDPHEFLYGYGERLAEQIGRPDHSLFIPVIDLDAWTPGEGGARTEICFYASKYQEVHKAQVFGLPAGAVEISRNLADSLNRAELVDLLRRSRRLYVFENTALAIEAPLCGCPVVMMPNPYLSYPIGDKDHGMGGIAWGDEPAEVARATESVDQMRIGYQAAIDRFPSRLNLFIERTQAYRNSIPGFGTDCGSLRSNGYERDAARYALNVLSPSGDTSVSIVKKALEVIRRRGVLSVCKVVLNLVRLSLSNLFSRQS